MKNEFSVVIICKNEGAAIGPVLQSVQHLTDDVVVYDSGSTDNTAEVVGRFSKATFHNGSWQGFGPTKKTATALAKYDWILSLDADEAVDDALGQQLLQLPFTDPKNVYKLRFKNFLGGQHVKWGEWGRDQHIRLFNRLKINWNDAPVHEELVLPNDVVVKKLEGYILHHTVKDTAEYSQKMVRYTMLNADKYFVRGKRATWLKLYLAPPFAFVKYYLLQLGFLDGWAGLVCARMTAFYTFLKYARLRELQQARTGKTVT